MEINKYIETEIKSNIDLTYKKFYSSLCPTISNIEGVRVPVLRKIAKEVSKEKNVKSYLENPILNTYEEKTIYGLVIGYMKTDINIYQKYLKKFIPIIDNWSTCDIVCSNLKFTHKYQKEMYKFINLYLESNHEYEVRFALVMLMNYFLNDEYYLKVLESLKKVNCSNYYTKMAESWLLSVSYIKYKEETLLFLESDLDEFIYKKTLQKILESKRISKEEKAKLKRKMK
jgi:3-methyladenine DNA glycosylase AlkD